MTIIDTSVMVAFLKGAKETVEKIGEIESKNDPPVLTIITAYELLKGACLSSKRQDNLIAVREAISNLQVLDLSPEACEEASKIYCDLKQSGKLIGEFDILIAAITKTRSETLLTRDRHFKAVKGLNLLLW